jgi:hypothetical protein
MAASVLSSPEAVAMSLLVVRAFVRLRQLLTADQELAVKLAALEKKYDAKFRVVFDAIRELMQPPPRGKRPSDSGWKSDADRMAPALHGDGPTATPAWASLARRRARRFRPTALH